MFKKSSDFFTYAVCAAFVIAAFAQSGCAQTQASAAAAGEAESSAKYRNMLIVYEDNDRFFVGAKETTVEALRANVSRLAGGKITHLFM